MGSDRNHLSLVPNEHVPCEGEIEMFPETQVVVEDQPAEEPVHEPSPIENLAALAEMNRQRAERLASLGKPITGDKLILARLDALTEMVIQNGQQALMLEFLTQRNIAVHIEQAEAALAAPKLIVPR